MFRLVPGFRNVSGVATSAPAAIVVTEDDRDEVAPLDSDSPTITHADTAPAQDIPPWVRELNNSRLARTRHSRASSVVSTATKFTTTTTFAEDARSIDINVAGQYFRISRDGSKVTADAPPPYSPTGPALYASSGLTSETSPASASSDTTGEAEDEVDECEDGATTPRSSFMVLDTAQGIRANILDPTEFDMPSPVGPDQLSHRASSATLVDRRSSPERTLHTQSSFEQGSEDISTAVGGRSATSIARSPNLRRHPVPHSSPLRRTNGVRLPRLNTSADTSTEASRARRSPFDVTSFPRRPLQVHSAGAVLTEIPLSRLNRQPRSPDFIGRNADALFPCTNTTCPVPDPSCTAGAATITTTRSSPPPDTHAEISQHYISLMRTLDATHRSTLHARDKSISNLQEKLNEKDIVLRQQLRAKDFIIEDLRQRLENLEEGVEMRLEKARHEVEDLWEERWKERDIHLRERMRRIEEDARRIMGRGTEDIGDDQL
jgi:hypothetical protein